MEAIFKYEEYSSWSRMLAKQHTVDELNKMLGISNKKSNNYKKEHENAIKELNDQIDYLKLTPAKRKKIYEAKAAQITVDGADLEELIISDEILKDGGSF